MTVVWYPHCTVPGYYPITAGETWVLRVRQPCNLDPRVFYDLNSLLVDPSTHLACQIGAPRYLPNLPILGTYNATYLNSDAPLFRRSLARFGPLAAPQMGKGRKVGTRPNNLTLLFRKRISNNSSRRLREQDRLSGN